MVLLPFLRELEIVLAYEKLSGPCAESLPALVTEHFQPQVFSLSTWKTMSYHSTRC